MKRIISAFVLMCILGMVYLQAKAVDKEIIKKQPQGEISQNQILDAMKKYVVETGRIEGRVEKGTESEESLQNETKGKKEQIISRVSSIYFFEEYSEKNHQILEYDICASSKFDYNDTLLREYLEFDVEFDQERGKKLGIENPIEIDYHVFDFNDDGYEDYLVCLYGVFNNESRIYVQDKAGSLKMVGRINMRLYTGDRDEDGNPLHERLTILDEKTDGYYAIVVPGSNWIFRYEKEIDYYVCHGKKNGKEHLISPASRVYDFKEDIENKHKILEYDICSSPQLDYKATPLREYLEKEAEEHQDKIGSPLEIDYHIFDFNDDGYEDYFVCLNGALYCGSGGIGVRIYIQEKNGTLSRVLDINMRLHTGYYDENRIPIHERLTILDEKTDGYYAIVVPGSNRILRYEKETGSYDIDKFVSNNGQFSCKEVSENVLEIYGVPLNEIAERIEYMHKLESMPNVVQKDYGELGELDEQGTRNILVYVVDGNKILFIPEDKVNLEIMINGEKCKVYYSEKTEGYIFYLIEDWKLQEDGVPINSIESNSITYCTVGMMDEKQEYDLSDLNYLGKAEVNLDVQTFRPMRAVNTIENEYINVMLDYVSETLREKEMYGSYDIYIYSMERIGNKDAGTNCCIKVAVVGDMIREYAVYIIYDNGDIEGVFPLIEKVFENSSGCHTNRKIEEKYESLIDEIVKLNREGIHLEITKNDNINVEEENQSHNNFDYNSEMDFRNMSARDAAKWIEYICSYCEYFGMNELGYEAGEIIEFNNKEVVMYTWNNRATELLFIPMDKVNTLLKGEEGKKYPVYINKDGNMEFYQIEGNPYVSNPGQLKTTLITSYRCPIRYIDSLSMLGEEVIKMTQLSQIDIPIIETDEYTLALEKYIKNMLIQSGKNGKYDIQIGEYEALHTNKVCISAAVIGEQEYYVRYLIVKYGENKYYFWPVGFGLDGSLEECLAESHKMNEICIERIKKLR